MVAREDIGGAQLTASMLLSSLNNWLQDVLVPVLFSLFHNMVTSLIDKYATGALRSHWGPLLTKMEVLGSYCLTEPESGSDAASLKNSGGVRW